MRSAISSCHTRIDGSLVGQHPLIIQLLKGMLNIRPPQPMYPRTWNVAKVTSYLDSLGDNSKLSLKALTMKLAMLFALTCTKWSLH